MTEPSPETETVAWGTTDFRPGSDIGLVARNTVGLIARDNPSTRDRLWELVSTDAPIDDILDELSSTGLKALPDFGLVQAEGSGVRIVARGAVTVEAETADDGVRAIDASDVRTWVEEVIADVAAVTLALVAEDGDMTASDGEAFAVLAGSVPARSLTRRFDTADPLAEDASGESGWVPQATSVAAADAAPAETPADDEPHDGEQPEAADEPAESPEDESPDMPEVDLEMPAADDQPDSLDTDDPSPTPKPSGEDWFDDPGKAPGSGTPSEPIPPQPSVGDDPVPARPAVEVTADPIDPSDALATAVPSGPGTGAAPPVSPSPTADVTPPPPADVTTVLPDGEAEKEPLPASSVSALFDDDAGQATQTFTEDHDGMTVSRDQLEAQRGDADDGAVAAVLAFSNGERIDVDRPVLIGRNPKVAGSASGTLPRIMKFDGPGQGLSRTHAEVRVDGGELVVEDLHSTNGTEIQLPGRPRQRLRAGEPVAIVPGSLIDFGDELHCTVESAG